MLYVDKNSLTLSLEKSFSRVKDYEHLLKGSKDEISKLTKQYASDLDSVRRFLRDKDKEVASARRQTRDLNEQLKCKEDQLSLASKKKEDAVNKLRDIQVSIKMLSEENVILHRQVGELRSHIFQLGVVNNEPSNSVITRRTLIGQDIEGKLEELDLMIAGLSDLVRLSKRLTMQAKNNIHGHGDDKISVIENDCVEFMRVNSKLTSYLQKIGVGLRDIYSRLEPPETQPKLSAAREMQIETSTQIQSEEFSPNQNTKNAAPIQSSCPAITNHEATLKEQASVTNERKLKFADSHVSDTPKTSSRPIFPQRRKKQSPDRFEKIQAELDAISERLSKCTTEQKLLAEVMHKGT